MFETQIRSAMTKLNEFDLQILEQKYKYINEVWSNWNEARLQTLHRITNYLFILNTGALIAALTYIATKGVNDQILYSIWGFFLGITCSVIHATLDYYFTEKSFVDYRKDVYDLYALKLDWEELLSRNDHRPRFDWLLHLFGWIGGIAFFVSLTIGLQQIPALKN